MSFNAIKYYGFFINHCHGCTTVTRFTLTIKICLKTRLPRVNLRQITLLRGYIHPKEQSDYYLSFRCTTMILHISRMRRNINWNVYNAANM